MIDLQLLAVGSVIALGASVGSYFYGVGVGKDVASAEHQRAYNELLVASQEALLASQEKANKIKQENEESLRLKSEELVQMERNNAKLQSKVNKLLRDKPKDSVYNTCVNDADVLRDINQALRNGKGS